MYIKREFLSIINAEIKGPDYLLLLPNKFNDFPKTKRLGMHRATASKPAMPINSLFRNRSWPL